MHCALYPFITVFSRASTPFHVICTPMQSSTKATIRKMPCAVCAEIRSVIFGA